MALKAINNSEYGRLLWKIDHLPYEIAVPLRKELNEAYARYHRQLLDLSETIAVYESVATKVKTRQVLKKVVEISEQQLIEQA